MSGYTVVLAELDDAATEVDAVLTALTKGTRTSTTAVDDLLAGGWSGIAADAFRLGWADWHTGAVAVTAALGRIHDAIERTAAAYRDAEAHHVATFNGVTR